MLLQSGVQIELLLCVQGMMDSAGQGVEPVSQELFNIILAVMALHRNDIILTQVCYTGCV